MIKARVFGLVILGILAVFAWPDHAPHWLLSPSEPETSLVGIVVGETTIAEVDRRFGPFESSKDVSDDGTETEYLWQLPLSEIRVTTMHPPRAKAGSQQIVAVEVREREGKRSKARTGAGVTIGDDLEALTETYGSRYMTSWRDLSSGSTTVTFIFANETELSAGFSDAGRIKVFLLVESQE